MKPHEFVVLFTDNTLQYFYCTSFKECIFIAMYYKYVNSEDCNIQSISCEELNERIDNIFINYSTKPF